MVPVLNSGDTAWMLISTALVILMTIPGVALFLWGSYQERKCIKYNVFIFCKFCSCKHYLVRIRL